MNILRERQMMLVVLLKNIVTPKILKILRFYLSKS